MSFHAPLGQQINHTVENAIVYANEHNERVDFNFNGTLVTVRPGDSVSTIVDKWFNDFETNAKAYRNSPEGKRVILNQLYRELGEIQAQISELERE